MKISALAAASPYNDSERAVGRPERLSTWVDLRADFVWVRECLLLGATAVPILHVHAEDAQALTGLALPARSAPPVKYGLEQRRFAMS
jgi:hypothetical protein